MIFVALSTYFLCIIFSHVIKNIIVNRESVWINALQETKKKRLAVKLSHHVTNAGGRHILSRCFKLSFGRFFSFSLSKLHAFPKFCYPISSTLYYHTTSLLLWVPIRYRHANDHLNKPYLVGSGAGNICSICLETVSQTLQSRDSSSQTAFVMYRVLLLFL